MYYDYDFSAMLDELQDLNTTNSNIYIEIQTMHQEQTQFYQDINKGISFISIILVITIAVKVMFK